MFFSPGSSALFLYSLLLQVLIPLAIVGLLVALVVGSWRRRRTEPQSSSLVERLRELDRLLADGVITPDEHAAARARLLGTL
ncbi:MAG: SHOCT domain-containing protein [Promicromonosporaceae bacterium]|nr:SHOCT domain-containing protein [Promicromonosporaceae bacterium]